MFRSRRVALLAIATAAACVPPVQVSGGAGADVAPPPGTTRELVDRMRAHYADEWYETLVFRQENVAYTSAGEQASSWMEYQHVPKRLRIEFVEPVANGSGIIFRNDSAYSFDNGKLARAVAQLHPLLLLSGDLYALPTNTTMAALAQLRIDTTRLRRDEWQGAPVYVVGAAEGDSAANQFWVDVEQMLVRRIVHVPATASATVPPTDYHFAYQDVDGFMVPREILFHRGGRPYFRETYVDVRPNAVVADSLFDPARWAAPAPTP